MIESHNKPPLKKGTIQRRAKRDRYTPVACNECKLRKVKCSGHSSCRRCTKHAISCVYDRMLPSEVDALNARGNGGNIQSKLSRMQASLDNLLQSIKPDVVIIPATHPPQSAMTASSSLAGSRKGSDGGSDVTIEDLAALVGIGDTACCMSGLQGPVQSQGSQQLPPTYIGNATSGPGGNHHPLWPLLRHQALEVLDDFGEEIDTFYPFINLPELKILVDTLYCSIYPQNRTNFKTAQWSDMDDSRNLDFLKLILACGLAIKSKEGNDLSRELIRAVEENNLRRMDGLDLDMKDSAIATMLSVYYYQNDEVTIAWRKIGAAARICLEIGLHKIDSLSKDEIGTRQAALDSKLFWCVYVLDRRYSFITNLPFALRDDDIDPKLPLPDNCSPYLIPMITYGGLGAIVVPALPKLKSGPDNLDNSACTYLGSEIDRWMQSTAIDTSPKSNPANDFSPTDSQTSNDNLATFCRIRGNQMRLSLYKSALHSPTRIARNPHLAQLAVNHAIDNIRILLSLNRNTNSNPNPTTTPLHNPSSSSSSSSPSSPAPNHPCPPHQTNFFLKSSTAILYLAIRNAPQRYSASCMHEYLGALSALRASAEAPMASRQLKETVRMLERATLSLVGPPVVAGAEMAPTQMTAAAAAGGEGPGQGWDVLRSGGGGGEGVGVERREEEMMQEEARNQEFGNDEGPSGTWEGGPEGMDGVGTLGGGMGAGHEFWTFTDDMGWLAPPDSYFLEAGSTPNGVAFGDYWPQSSGE